MNTLALQTYLLHNLTGTILSTHHQYQTAIHRYHRGKVVITLEGKRIMVAHSWQVAPGKNPFGGVESIAIQKIRARAFD